MQGDMGSIPGQGTNTAHAMWGQPKKSLFFFFNPIFKKFK